MHVGLQILVLKFACKHNIMSALRMCGIRQLLQLFDITRLSERRLYLYSSKAIAGQHILFLMLIPGRLLRAQAFQVTPPTNFCTLSNYCVLKIRTQATFTVDRWASHTNVISDQQQVPKSTFRSRLPRFTLGRYLSFLIPRPHFFFFLLRSASRRGPLLSIRLALCTH